MKNIFIKFLLIYNFFLIIVVFVKLLPSSLLIKPSQKCNSKANTTPKMEDKIMAGYCGYSMSNNAVDAYNSGEKPISKWKKQDITYYGIKVLVVQVWTLYHMNVLARTMFLILCHFPINPFCFFILYNPKTTSDSTNNTICQTSLCTDHSSHI